MAQVVRLTIPWFFGEAVNALQAQGMEGITRARNDLLLMLAAVGVAWTMHGPARIVERFTALVVRERFADALHAKALALPVRWHEQHHSGDTLHRMTRATSSLASFAQSQFIYLQNTVSVVGPIAALFLISRATGAAAMAGYAAIGYFVARAHQRRHGRGRTPVLPAGRERGRGHGDALERPRSAEDRGRRCRPDLHQPRAPDGYRGGAGRLARNPGGGRALRPPGSWRGAAGARRRLDRAPPRTADRVDRRERGGKDLAASRPRRAGRPGRRVDRGGRNAPSAPEAPGRDCAARARG